jgi:hypothetical protein
MNRAPTHLRQPRRHVHRTLGPLLTSIKGRSRALVRGGGRAGGRADEQAHSLSPSRTLVTPYCKRIRPGRRTTRAAVPLIVFPLVFRLAPTHLGWDTQRQFTRRCRDPPGVETQTGGELP